jgi:hypothetical protein
MLHCGRNVRHRRLYRHRSSNRSRRNHMALRNHRTCRCFGYHRTRRGMRGNGRMNRRRSNNRRSLTRLRNNFTRFRTSRSHTHRRRRGYFNDRRRRLSRQRGGWRSRRRWTGRRLILPCLGLFLSLNRFQHVTGLGHVREIDLGYDLLWRTPRRRAVTSPASPLKVRTHLIGLVVLQGTGVGLTAG